MAKGHFDWYAACLATGITCPFVMWGLYVLARPHVLIIIAVGVLFLSFVFWAFGMLIKLP